MSAPRVVVTGAGVVCPIAADLCSFAEQLASPGASGRTITLDLGTRLTSNHHPSAEPLRRGHALDRAADACIEPIGHALGEDVDLEAKVTSPPYEVAERE